jgi:hypothetical protein
MFKIWGLKKNVSKEDMAHVVRIKKRRREVDGKETIINVRKRRVADSKFERRLRNMSESIIDAPAASSSQGTVLLGYYISTGRRNLIVLTLSPASHSRVHRLLDTAKLGGFSSSHLKLLKSTSLAAFPSIQRE